MSFNASKNSNNDFSKNSLSLSSCNHCFRKKIIKAPSVDSQSPITNTQTARINELAQRIETHRPRLPKSSSYSSITSKMSQIRFNVIIPSKDFSDKDSTDPNNLGKSPQQKTELNYVNYLKFFPPRRFTFTQQTQNSNHVMDNKGTMTNSMIVESNDIGNNHRLIKDMNALDRSVSEMQFKVSSFNNLKRFRWSISNYNLLDMSEMISSVTKKKAESLPHLNLHILAKSQEGLKEFHKVRTSDVEIQLTQYECEKIIKLPDNCASKGDLEIEYPKPKRCANKKRQIPVQGPPTIHLQKNSFEFIQDFIELKNQQRFLFVKQLGEGSFGRVLECVDLRKQRTAVAIKVSKRIVTASNYGTREIQNLERLWSFNSTDLNPCVNLINWFYLEGHTCLVFKKYGDNLLSVMRRRNFNPLSYKAVTWIAFQLLNALIYLHQICNIVHCDIKPQNILLTCLSYIMTEERGQSILETPAKFDIKLADFGQSIFATPEHKIRHQLVSTVNYRALEIILGLPWDYKVDYWSVGCVLFELLFGMTLFDAKEDLIHLRLIENFLGPMKCKMTKFSRKAHLFKSNGILNPKHFTDKLDKKLLEIRKAIFRKPPKESRLLMNLILNTLRIDPQDRCEARTLLQSSLFYNISESLKRRYITITG